MKRIVSIIWCVVCVNAMMAQHYTISGYVSDAESGERLIGAAVYDTVSRQGAVTNTAGFYTLTLPAGQTCALVASYVGYAPSTVFSADSAQTRHFALTGTTHLQEVTVTGRTSISAPDNVQMSAIDSVVARRARAHTCLYQYQW